MCVCVCSNAERAGLCLVVFKCQMQCGKCVSVDDAASEPTFSCSVLYVCKHKLVRRLFVFSIFAPIYVFVWSISGKCQLLYTRSDCTETRSSYTVCGGCGEGFG